MVKTTCNIKLEVRKFVVEAVQNGATQAEAAKQFHINQSTVSRLIAKFKAGMDLSDRPRAGRPRKTTEKLDRIIRRKSTGAPKKTAKDIAQEINEEHQVEVSAKTVGRRLDSFGLRARTIAKKPWINAKNRKARIEFSMRHRHWSPEDWERVLWTDESKFCLFGSDGTRYMRRPDGQRYNPRYTEGTVKHGGGNVMVYGAFAASGVGPLIKIDGRMDGLMFRNILADHTVPFGNANLSSDWVHQMDNDPKHRSKLVQEWMTDNHVRQLEWPSQSPDLNPIENLWDGLGKAIGSRPHKNSHELFQDLQAEWQKLPNTLLCKLVHSMPNRIEAVIKAKGYPTKY